MWNRFIIIYRYLERKEEVGKTYVFAADRKWSVAGRHSSDRSGPEVWNLNSSAKFNVYAIESLLNLSLFLHASSSERLLYASLVTLCSLAMLWKWLTAIRAWRIDEKNSFPAHYVYVCIGVKLHKLGNGTEVWENQPNFHYFHPNTNLIFAWHCRHSIARRKPHFRQNLSWAKSFWDFLRRFKT